MVLAGFCHPKRYWVENVFTDGRPRCTDLPRRTKNESRNTGRHALICGASSSLGLACADTLAAEGVQVTLVPRSKHKLQEAARQIEASTGIVVKWIAADLSQAIDR
ncbi:SDR family NAD(P)-dependent oxidoreductase [Alcaligenes sp. GCM10023179]|uniref:SDR family NAD(P)-dependent oxidoreductase n=1 Tax=Alcaligenes sp. GCM10023179 TaxID=3252633 RepID=UPI00361E8966